MKRYETYLTFLFILVFALLAAACGGDTEVPAGSGGGASQSADGGSASDAGGSTADSDGASQSSSGIGATTPGVIEFTMPDGDQVNIPLSTCGQLIETRVNVAEFTSSAAWDYAWIDFTISYDAGEGTTGDGFFHIFYGPQAPEVVFEGTTEQASITRDRDGRGQFSDLTVNGQTFSARWQCPAE